jgi:type II secretory pathway pseudopilin PulG
MVLLMSYLAGHFYFRFKRHQGENRNVPNGPGFTLVELLIAATMMSVLFIGLGSHLRGGIAVWRQTTQRVDALQRQRVALDRLERDLANAFVYDPSGSAQPAPPALRFEPSQLAFYTIQPKTQQQQPAVRYVTYWYGQRDVDGTSTQGLWRTSQSLGEARSPSHKPAQELILPECETLSLRYAYAPADETAALEWLDKWLYQNVLPRLIEVTVRMSSGRDVTRVMAIPQGSLKQAQPP